MFSPQFISHQTDRYTYADSIRIALEGGCKWIQLRMKDAADDEIREVANEVLPLCRKHNAIFLLDDRVELAIELKADGVHLGKNDMPVSQARSLMPNAIIGGTANTIEDIRRLNSEGASYIGCGPFRFTTTKKGLAPILGLEGYSQIVLQMKNDGIDLPVVAIGGITIEDVFDILNTGINGVAISGAVLNAQNPVDMMRRFCAYTDLMTK